MALTDVCATRVCLDSAATVRQDQQLCTICAPSGRQRAAGCGHTLIPTVTARALHAAAAAVAHAPEHSGIGVATAVLPAQELLLPCCLHRDVQHVARLVPCTLHISPASRHTSTPRPPSAGRLHRLPCPVHQAQHCTPLQQPPAQRSAAPARQQPAEPAPPATGQGHGLVRP